MLGPPQLLWCSVATPPGSGINGGHQRVLTESVFTGYCARAQMVGSTPPKVHCGTLVWATRDSRPMQGLGPNHNHGQSHGHMPVWCDSSGSAPWVHISSQHRMPAHAKQVHLSASDSLMVFTLITFCFPYRIRSYCTRVPLHSACILSMECSRVTPGRQTPIAREPHTYLPLPRNANLIHGQSDTCTSISVVPARAYTTRTRSTPHHTRHVYSSLSTETPSHLISSALTEHPQHGKTLLAAKKSIHVRGLSRAQPGSLGSACPAPQRRKPMRHRARAAAHAAVREVPEAVPRGPR